MAVDDMRRRNNASLETPIDEEWQPLTMGRMTRRWPTHSKVALVVTVVMVVFGISYFTQFRQWLPYNEAPGIVPQALLGTVYSPKDFKNDKNVVPAFWGCGTGQCNTSEVWGPCYAPQSRVDWPKEVAKAKNSRQPPLYHREAKRGQDANDLTDYCRPGFIIIGAGKCGTSSLYHYLTGHPRVLPASEKQIHYFKVSRYAGRHSSRHVCLNERQYFPEYPLKWYYQHFPTTTNFLASGALMTGEASPGYLPYPSVVNLVRERLPGPRFLALGRNPLERSYSSYRYNYLNPTLEWLQNGKEPAIEGGKPLESYHRYLFSYEDMIRAELNALYKCLAPNGEAIQGAKKKWMGMSWAAEEYNRRAAAGLPPLVDLDGFCYGSAINMTILRPQWADLVAKYPEKVIGIKNLHLKQSLIGRSLYTLPLEWWYAGMNYSELYFVCTEELSDLSGEPMNKVADFLGLPAFNFTPVLSTGAYNVGGYKGYDKEVSWDVLDQTNVSKAGPLPDNLLQELKAFVEPFNERLFQLIGKRCNW